MESPSLVLPRFTPTPTRVSTRTSPETLPSPLLPHSSLRLCAPPRHIRLFASSSGGPNAAGDGDGDGKARKIKSVEDRRDEFEKVKEAFRNSNDDLRTFFRNLIDAGVLDEADLGGKNSFLMKFIEADDLPGSKTHRSVMWKVPVVAVLSFAGVPKLLGYLGDAADAHVPAWMPLVYSLLVFLLGTLLVADTSLSEDEWAQRRKQARQQFAFVERDEVMWRMARRVPVAMFAVSAAGEAALCAAAAVTGLDLDPPIWVAFLLFGIFLGVPYGLFSTSLDPAVEGSFVGWEELVRNIRELVIEPGLERRRKRNK